MYAKVVSQLSNSGTGTQDFTHGESWTPKVAIFQWNRANTSADAFQEHMAYGKGFTDGTNQRCVSIVSEDNQARADSARIQRNDAVICALTPTGTVTTVDAVASFSSWLSNGIRINWTDAPSAQFYVSVLLLGGNDITDVAVGTIMSGTTTGIKSVTSLSFQGDYAMFLHGGSITENTAVVSASFSEGHTTGNSAMWCQSIYSLDNPVTMSTAQIYDHTEIVFANTDTIIDGAASFDSFTSNGFQIFAEYAWSSNMPIYYLVMKGGQYKVGNSTEPTGTGQQTITTNTDVKAVMVLGLDTSTGITIQNGCMWTSGMATATDNQICDVFEDTDNVADSIVVSRHDTNQLYLNFTSNVTATSSVLDDEAEFYSKSATNVIVNWTNIGQARPFRYVTYGGANLIDVTKTVTLKQNILQEVTKQVTLKDDIYQDIVKQASIKYNIIQEVTKTCDILFDIQTYFKKALVTVLSSQDGSNNQDITFAENWTPKVAIVQYHRAITSLDTFQENVVYGFGFTNGTNSRHICTATEDNQDISDTARIQNNDSLICCLTPTGTVGTVDGKATFSQWLTGDNSGMRINWSDVPSEQFYITVMFLGGEDITDVDVGTLYTTTSLGNKSITSLDYTADFGIFLSSGTSTENSPTSIAEICIGAATGVSGNVNQWCQTVFSNHNSSTSSTRQSFCHDRVGFHHGTSMTGQINFLGFNSTGFTVNLPTSYGSNCPIYWLVMKGGQYSVGNATEPTSTGVQTITNNKNNEAIMVFGVDYSTSNYIGNNNRWSCGMGTGSGNQYISCFGDNNGSNYTVNGCRLDSNQIYQIPSITATIGSSTLNDEAQIDNLSNGSFGLNWTNIGSANPYRYITIGGGMTLTTVIKSVTLRYNIMQEVSKQLSLLQSILQEVPKSTTLKFDIVQEVEKQITILSNIIGEITKQATLKSNIYEEVSKSTSIKFGIMQEIHKQITIIHSILQEVSKSTSLRFDIIAEIVKQVTVIFNIYAAGLVDVIKTVTLKSSIYQEIPKSVTVKFGIMQEISKQLTLLSSIIQEVEKQVTLKSDIDQEVIKSTNIKFSIIQEVTKQLTILSNIYQEVAKSVTTKFSLFEEITKSTSLKFNISAEITKQLTVLFNIYQQGFVDVVKTVSTLFNIAQEVPKSISLKSDIYEEVEKDAAIKFSVFQEIAKTSDIKFSIIQEVIKTNALLFSVIQEVEISKTLRHDIYQEIEKDTTVVFDIIQDIVKQLSVVFDIYSLIPTWEIIKTVGTKFNIYEETTKTTALRFDILQELIKQLKIQFDIHGKDFIESDFAVQSNKWKDIFGPSDHTWNILNHLSKLKWNKRKGWYISKP